MKTLLTKGGNSITVSDEEAARLMEEEPGAFTVVTDLRRKMVRGLSDKMLRTAEVGETK